MCNCHYRVGTTHQEDEPQSLKSLSPNITAVRMNVRPQAIQQLDQTSAPLDSSLPSLLFPQGVA